MPSQPSSLHSGLDEDQVRALVDSVLGAVNPSAPMGIYLFGPNHAGASLGRWVEEMVFGESFGNTPELLSAEYGRYEKASIFFCAVDHIRRLPIGVMRVVLPNRSPGLKSLNDLYPIWGVTADQVSRRTGISLPSGGTWDIATLATHPEYRGNAGAGLISLALCRSMVTTEVACGANHVVAILDRAIQEMLIANLYEPFQAYKGVPALPYLGSVASTPVWCDLIEYRARLRAGSAELDRLIFEGEGIDAAVQPLTTELAVAQVKEVLASLAPGHRRDVDGAPTRGRRRRNGSIRRLTR